MILLDTLFPPPPAQLVADCRAVGAAGCWVYFLRRAADGTPLDNGTWTLAHVQALRAAGLLAPGIVVPGNVPPAADVVMAAARAAGVDPVIGDDLETASEPPAAWEDALDQAAAAAGYQELNYGPASVLGLYDPGEPGWLASWLRTGQLDPIPALPAGWRAWQFVNDLAINGSWYDASVVDPALFGGEMLDQTTVEKLLQGAADAGAARAEVTLGFQALADGSKDPAAPNYLSTRLDQLAALITGLDVAAIKTELDTMQSALAGLVAQGMPPANLQPLQDAIARLGAHLGVGTP